LRLSSELERARHEMEIGLGHGDEVMK
jgi:hypothetical protein